VGVDLHHKDQFTSHNFRFLFATKLACLKLNGDGDTDGEIKFGQLIRKLKTLAGKLTEYQCLLLDGVERGF
jgi:hypothetical protein